MKLKPQDCAVFEEKLLASGYRKYIQNFENADYCYWKSFEQDENGSPGYQVGIAFYDLTQFSATNDIHASFHFLLGNNSRVNRLDVSISDNKMSIEKFEKFCQGFYETWTKNVEEIVCD